MSYYSIPEGFQERLSKEFDNRIRVRWSYALNEFHVEQKIARGLVDQFPVVSNRDDLIRLRDGYMQIMSVRNGTRMPCPRCHLDITNVPKFETGMIACAKCGQRVVAGFFYLDDRLIDYLRSLDPLRGRARENRNRVDMHNARIEKSHDRHSDNVIEDAVSEDFNHIAGIQMVGYTGKEFTG